MNGDEANDSGADDDRLDNHCDVAVMVETLGLDASREASLCRMLLNVLLFLFLAAAPLQSCKCPRYPFSLAMTLRLLGQPAAIRKLLKAAQQHQRQR